MATGKRRSGNRLPPFVALTWGMLNSKAYKALTHSAARALPYFLGKVKAAYDDPQRYLIEFHLSYAEAKKYGLSNSTHYRVICELMEKGFIDPVDKGGLRSDGKSFNLFRLSGRWEKYETDAFKKEDWKTFLPRVTRKPLQEWN